MKNKNLKKKISILNLIPTKRQRSEKQKLWNKYSGDYRFAYGIKCALEYYCNKYRCASWELPHAIKTTYQNELKSRNKLS